jgi:hypothetical protein
MSENGKRLNQDLIAATLEVGDPEIASLIEQLRTRWRSFPEAVMGPVMRGGSEELVEGMRYLRDMEDLVDQLEMLAAAQTRVPLVPGS